MPLTALLVVDLHDTPGEQQAAFRAAMSEQGWQPASGVSTAYRAAFEMEDEQAVLDRAKELVTSARLQAKVTDCDVTCLVSPHRIRTFI